MKLFRYRRPSLNTLLGITKAKKEIKKELGLSTDSRTAEMEALQARIDKLKLSDESRARIKEEMDKLAVLEPASPEYTVTRNYLDWLTILPWGLFSDDRLDIVEARRILDARRRGLPHRD